MISAINSQHKVWMIYRDPDGLESDAQSLN